MKKEFSEPAVNVMRLNNYDVICASPDDTKCGGIAELNEVTLDSII